LVTPTPAIVHKLLFKKQPFLLMQAINNSDPSRLRLGAA